MDMIKKYGTKELARMTYRDVRERRNKKQRDLDCHVADVVRKIKRW